MLAAIVGGIVLGVLPSGWVAVAEPDDPTTGCQTGSTPTVEIPRRDDREPRIRVPVPEGWEQVPDPGANDESIRLAILNPELTARGFTPNAVIALTEVASGVASPREILDTQNELLVARNGASDLVSKADQVCGLPASTITYTVPATDAIPPRNALTRVVVDASGTETFIVTVTVQSVEPRDGGYAQDAQNIVNGLQVLPAT